MQNKDTCTMPCCNGSEVEVFAFDNLFMVKGSTTLSHNLRILARHKDGVCMQFDRACGKCGDLRNQPLLCRESLLKSHT